MSYDLHANTCPHCDNGQDEIARRCSGCGNELIGAADFYPALWAYGCPDHDECREQLKFEDGKLHCPRHGCAYWPGEKRLDEPIVLDAFTLYDMGTHVLNPIAHGNSRGVDHYTIMSCPKCDPSGYFIDPDGPQGSAVNSLYVRCDGEGRHSSASCRHCDLSNAEYQEIVSQRGQRGLADCTDLSSKIDSVANSIAKAESLIESIPTKVQLEGSVPRWQQVTVGLLSLPLSVLLLIGSIGASSAITDGKTIGWFSYLLPAVTLTLSVFFGLVAYRLLLNRPRRSFGRLLSPVFVVTFGVFFSSFGIWLFFRGDGDLTMVLIGLASISIGVAWHNRSRSATRDDRS